MQGLLHPGRRVSERESDSSSGLSDGSGASRLLSVQSLLLRMPELISILPTEVPLWQACFHFLCVTKTSSWSHGTFSDELIGIFPLSASVIWPPVWYTPLPLSEQGSLNQQFVWWADKTFIYEKKKTWSNAIFNNLSIFSKVEYCLRRKEFGLE